MSDGTPERGERGRQGDHGQSGDDGRTGETGQPGAMGLTGRTGEMGGVGRTGQTGQPGATGQVGRTGDAGRPGATGPQGPRVLSRAQTITGFVFVVTCFVILAWRTETAADNIQRNADRITANTAAIADVQQRTSDRVLCPLYQVFVDSIDNAPPLVADRDLDGQVTAAEQTLYDQAVVVIRAGYAELGCRPSTG